jgi:hypothetical protein
MAISSQGTTEFSTKMATWNDLPLEIRDHIVYFFCLDIITEYDAPPTDIFNSEYYNLDNGKKTSSVKLAPPECLSDFDAAVRTSRYFHHAINYNIMFDGNSAASTLKLMQADKFDSIYDTPEHNRLFEQKHLDALVGVIGFYWNNPICLMNSRDLIDFLLYQVPGDHVPWFSRAVRRRLSNHATSAQEFPKRTPYICGSSDLRQCLRLYFNVGSLSKTNEEVDFFSIEGTAAADDEFDDVDLLWMECEEEKFEKHGKQAVCHMANCLGIDLRRAIEDAPPNTWYCMIDKELECKWLVVNMEMNTVVHTDS